LADKNILNLTSLKDQVYEYIREQMKNGRLQPGDTIDMKATSQMLGISITPLRDALIRLEMEGFVRILPRRGVIVNELTVQDIQDYYQILGALESIAVIAAGESLHAAEIERMHKLNAEMTQALAEDDFDLYYEKNLRFHDIFLKRSGNDLLREMVATLKKRLYDFPRRAGYVKEWEEASVKEHAQFLSLLGQGKYLEAANYIRDVHWSFRVQEKYIKKYYQNST
jgi:DNA-binding GntR family transcriptional regulator